MSDTDAVLATVREALTHWQKKDGEDVFCPDARDVNAALDSLAAELELVKAERDEDDRPHLLPRRDLWERVRTAEARLGKALSALRAIERHDFPIFTTGDFDPLEDAAACARAAIAEIEGEA